MNLLKIILIQLLLIGFCAPSYAAIDDVEPVSGSGVSDKEETGDKKSDKEKGDKNSEEEEPDCE